MPIYRRLPSVRIYRRLPLVPIYRRLPLVPIYRRLPLVPIYRRLPTVPAATCFRRVLTHPAVVRPLMSLSLGQFSVPSSFPSLCRPSHCSCTLCLRFSIVIPLAFLLALLTFASLSLFSHFASLCPSLAATCIQKYIVIQVPHLSQTSLASLPLTRLTSLTFVHCFFFFSSPGHILSVFLNFITVS